MKVSLTERSIGYQDEKEHPNEILEDRKRVGALRAKKKKALVHHPFCTFNKY